MAISPQSRVHRVMRRPTDYHRPLTYLRTILVLGCLSVALRVVCGPAGFAQPRSRPATANEANLMLARLYATAKFISWPDETSSPATPFVIGVIEPSPFGEGLAKLAERKLKDRPIRVVRFQTAADFRPCHLLFVPEGASPETTKELIDLSMNSPVLTWRESADTTHKQGIACTFIRQDEGLFIEADPTELKRRGLTPDGRLLRLNLVRVVKPGK